MNERTKQLANEAGLLVHNPNGVPTKLEKFAELIVRECADISDTSFHNGSAGYTAILKHFGVEE